MKYFLAFVLLLSCNIFAQKISFGLDYSRLITAQNYETVSIYTLGGDFEFAKYNFSIGVDFSAFVGEIYLKTIDQSSSAHKTFSEYPPTIKINVKYYTSLLDSYLNEDVKPYIIVAFGRGLVEKSFGINKNHTFYCGDHYSFSNKQYYYTNIGLGSIFLPTKILSFIFELKYQFSNPTITYEKPNCSGNLIPDSYTTYTEKVNLNMLFWTFGFRVNF